MKSTRKPIVPLILTLLLSSIPATGPHPARAWEPQADVVPTLPTDSSPHVPTSAEIAEPMHHSVSGAPSASAAIEFRGDDWHIECVDCPKYFSGVTDRSLRLDVAEHRHIAYGGEHLYSAWYNGATWYYETVDSTPDIGYQASPVLDGASYPHVSYRDFTTGDLERTFQNASGWHFQTPDGSGDVGHYTSLTMDENGYPHISYFDESNDALKYAYQDVSGWHTQTVDSEEGFIRYSDTSLALDASGTPHISYYGKSLPIELRYAFRDGAGWHSEVVFTGAQACCSYCGWVVATSVTLDGYGYPHISFFDFTYGYDDLKYAYRDASGWHVQTVDSEGDVGGCNSLALDDDGHPHISYREHSPSDALKYAYRDASGWHLQTVDGEGYVGMYTSLALDGAGYPHISYFDDSNNALKYAYRDAFGWHLQTVDSEGDVGYHTSLALDGSGYPHISYYDNTNGALKYAYRDAGGWHIRTVDSELDVGMYNSLALDGDGYPHISYYDYSNRDLKYTYCSPPTLAFTTYLPLVLKPRPSLKDLTTKTTVTLPQPLAGSAGSFCTWGGCSLSPRLYHEPIAGDRTLVGWTDSSDNGHASIISGDTIERTIDFPDKSVRGLVAHDDGTFAILLWSPDSKVIWLSKRGENGNEIWTRNLNGEGTNPDFWLGDGRLTYGNGLYVAYFTVKSTSGHHGDQLTYVDDNGNIQEGGWGWGCSHSLAELASYHPNLDQFVAVCSSDCYPGKGIFVNNHYQVHEADGNCGGNVSAQLGQIAPGEGAWKLLFNALDRPCCAGHGIALATIDENLQSSFKWLTNTDGAHERDPAIARWGSDAQEERYLVGWTTTNDGTYWLGIIDSDGNFLAGPEEVTSAGVRWGNRDDSFRTRADGSVSWVQGDPTSTELCLFRFEGSARIP